jgi:hypothetical protein
MKQEHYLLHCTTGLSYMYVGSSDLLVCCLLASVVCQLCSKKPSSYGAVYFLRCYRELAENKKATAALSKELTEAKLNVEISARQELVTALEEAQRTSQEEKEQLLAQVEDLRLKVRQAEEQHLE